MTKDIRNRVQKGVTTGGQFAAESRSESGVTLASSDRPKTLQEQYGIKPGHRHENDFTQLEGLRSSAAAILENYPQATTMKLTQNQDGENQWDIVAVTDADGNPVADTEDLDELGVDNPEVGDVAGGIWKLDKNYPVTNGAGVIDQGRPNDFSTMTVNLRAAATPKISPEMVNAPAPAAEQLTATELALSNAGISDGYAFEISGASITTDGSNIGMIELTNDEGTGGTLMHDYRSGHTSWQWEDEWMGEGAEENVDIAVEDITRGSGSAKEMFDKFRDELGK